MSTNKTDRLAEKLGTESQKTNKASAISKTQRLRKSVSVPIFIDAVPDEQSEDFWLKMHKHLNTFFGAIFSFLFHVVVLVGLAFVVFSRRDLGSHGIISEIITITKLEDKAPEETEIVIDIDTIEDNSSVVEEQATDNSLSQDPIVPNISDTDSNESESQSDISPIENNVPVQADQPQITGGGLEGRQHGSRSNLASRYGGTPQSELAVENGLRWLANHQFVDGSFRLDFTRGPCNGNCKDPGAQESTTAATGLAIMAFLGAGYTHKNGEYQQQVQAGIDYLVSRMRKSYWGGNLAEGSMYAQGIATIALSEAYAMTRDPKLKDVVESALKYIITAQHSAGGWRYNPGEPGDTTVTGWQLMALKSCQLAGIEVPMDTIKKARAFLASVGNESSGQFGYKSNDPDPTSTAIGLLMQMYHGWSREHRGLLAGSDFIVKQGPSANNIYYNYYATLMLFHARHQKWDAWNTQMRDYLIRTQSQKGHEAGSWFFKEKYGSRGGRLYTTAMAVMTLEVYYRYLPLFDSEPIAAGR